MQQALSSVLAPHKIVCEREERAMKESEREREGERDRERILASEPEMRRGSMPLRVDPHQGQATKSPKPPALMQAQQLAVQQALPSVLASENSGCLVCDCLVCDRLVCDCLVCDWSCM